MKKVVFEDWGRLDYKEAWDKQTVYFQESLDIKMANRKNGQDNPTTDRLIFVEHPPVFTLGKSGDIANLLVSEERLEKEGIDYYPVNRGGDITYHGPGQLVGYPIIDLDHYFTDIHKYLRFLEEVIILTLAEYGIESSRSEGETGVWIAPGTPFARKICAMGVKASRWVTMHGWALNVNSPLKHFGYIVPCGITDKSVTSLHLELEREVPMEEVAEKLKRNFEKVFECQIVNNK